MNIDIKHGPGSAAAHVQMEKGETVTAEGGSMISKSEHISIETTTHRRGQGSLTKAVKRMLASENFFLNHYKAHDTDEEVWLATALPGDMMVHNLDKESLVVQAGSFVACSEGVEVNWSSPDYSRHITEPQTKRISVMDRRVIRYSEAFKLRVISELESGELSTIAEARRRYCLRGGRTIQCWLKKYGKNSKIRFRAENRLKNDKKERQ